MSEPYYSDDLVTLYHGDCLDVLPSLADVDLIFTSPPYNLGVTTGGGFGHWKDGQQHGGRSKWKAAMHDGDGIGYSDHNDAMPYEEYEAWQRDVLRACWASLSARGAIYYNHKPRVQASTLWLPLALNPGLPLRRVDHQRRIGRLDRASGQRQGERGRVVGIALLRHSPHVTEARGRAALESEGGLGEDHDPLMGRDVVGRRVVHAARPGPHDDLFAGSGTTLRAAKDAGVRAVGIEKSERYCELAAKRLAQDTLFGGVA